jgi:hypothetical protein
VEWDTLLFFYGTMLCVGGLGALGYLATLSDFLYKDLGATSANILVGTLAAVIDNIPVMFAVLSMNPDMSLGQWLLVTLTAGVGGSLLSIGSAAGVALMGQARGIYTFSAHLKMDMGHCLGLCREYRRSSRNEWCSLWPVEEAMGLQGRLPHEGPPCAASHDAAWRFHDELS